MNSRFEEAQLSFFDNNTHHDNLAMAMMAMETMLVVDGNDGNEGDYRLQRWSFFHNDGMVMNFFGGTIAINGFSMVLLPLNHHH